MFGRRDPLNDLLNRPAWLPRRSLSRSLTCTYVARLEGLEPPTF